MLRYVLMRALQGLVTVYVAATIAFGLTHFIGDPVAQRLSLDATREQYMALRHELGYDRPGYVQYASFLGGAIKGDFGTSTEFDEPALGIVLSRLPVDLTLAGLAVGLALIVGIPIGALAGYRPYGLMDRVSLGIATIGQAVPGFVIAIFLILLFAVGLHLVPAGGWGTWQAAILPVVSLALFVMSVMIRLTRSGVREVMARPFILLARAKGLSEGRVVFAHALKPTLMPVITIGALQLGNLLTGAVVLETVMAIPGVGRLLVEAVQHRDQNVVLAATIVSAACFVGINVLTDLSYAVVDRRVRLGGRN